MRIARTSRFLTGLVLFSASALAHAQAYPTKPIRFLVPFPPGGGLDLLSRGLADPMSRQMGQPVVAENRPSGAGIVAAEALARSAPDGYTIMIGGNSLSVGSLLYKKLPFDPERDFSFISYLGDSYVQLWTHSSVPAANLKDFVSYTKANPGKLNFGSGGVGHAFHLAMEMFKSHTGTDLVHVPYKGMAAPVQDLIAGRLQAVWYVPSPPLLAAMKSGTVRVLATAGEKRNVMLPDTPTVTEAGFPGFKGGGTNFNLMASAGLPRALGDRLHAEVMKAMETPEAMRAFDVQTIARNPNTGEYAERIWREERIAWTPVIRSLNIYQD